MVTTAIWTDGHGEYQVRCQCGYKSAWYRAEQTAVKAAQEHITPTTRMNREFGGCPLIKEASQ